MDDELRQAVGLVTTGQYEQGLIAVKKVSEKADDDTLFQIAELYNEWGMAEEARTLLKQLLQTHPNDSYILLSLAEAAMDLDDEDQAIDCLLKIHQVDENYLSAQVSLADLYQAQGLEEAAERRLKEARKLAPDEPILTFALAEFYAVTGQPAQAAVLYKDVLHADVLEHENIPLKLAETLSFNGQFEEAMIYYRKGLDKEKTLDGLFGYAITASRTGQYQTVITSLEELKEMDPQYSTLYPVLAEAYRNEGAEEEALATLEAGIQLDEHNERMFLDASDLARRLGNSEKAATYLNRLLTDVPDHTDALKKLVELKKEAGGHEDIIRLLTAQPTQDPELQWPLAKAYTEEDELEKAINVYKGVYTNFKSDPEFLKDYGEVAWETGDRETALRLFHGSLKFDPNNEELQAFVERIEQEL